MEMEREKLLFQLPMLPLPLMMMNSFRTSADTMAALARYEDLAVEGLPLEFLQNKEPKLLAADLHAFAAGLSG